MFKIFDILYNNYNMKYWVHKSEYKFYCSNKQIKNRIPKNENYYTLQFAFRPNFIWFDIPFNKENEQFIKLVIQNIPNCEYQFKKNLDFNDQSIQKSLECIGTLCHYQVSNLSNCGLFSLSFIIDRADNLECLFKELEPFINKIKENN